MRANRIAGIFGKPNVKTHIRMTQKLQYHKNPNPKK